MKTRVKVIKFDGRTGLRLVGTQYDEYQDKAEKLSKLGLIEFVKEPETVVKEEKAVIETKELKLKRETKRKK